MNLSALATLLAGGDLPPQLPVPETKEEWDEAVKRFLLALSICQDSRDPQIAAVARVAGVLYEQRPESYLNSS